MKNSILIQSLDRIAGELESKGLVKLATELDIVSNTLEAAEAFETIPKGLYQEGEFAERMDLMNRWVSFLNESPALGKVPAVKGLKALFSRKRGEALANQDPDVILHDPAASAFLLWLHQRAQENEYIPNSLLQGGKEGNSRYKWELLAAILDILNEKLTAKAEIKQKQQERTKNVIDEKWKQIQEETRRTVNASLNLPRKYQDLHSLLGSLIKTRY